MEKEFRKVSKEDFVFPGHKPTHSDIQTGCMQRQADAAERTAAATELMAQNYQRLVDERDMYKRWYNEGSATIATLEKRCASYKGKFGSAKRQIGGLQKKADKYDRLDEAIAKFYPEDGSEVDGDLSSIGEKAAVIMGYL